MAEELTEAQKEAIRKTQERLRQEVGNKTTEELIAEDPGPSTPTSS